MAEPDMSSSSRRILAVALDNETAVLSKLVKGQYNHTLFLLGWVHTTMECSGDEPGLFITGHIDIN